MHCLVYNAHSNGSEDTWGQRRTHTPASHSPPLHSQYEGFPRIPQTTPSSFLSFALGVLPTSRYHPAPSSPAFPPPSSQTWRRRLRSGGRDLKTATRSPGATTPVEPKSLPEYAGERQPRHYIATVPAAGTPSATPATSDTPS